MREFVSATSKRVPLGASSGMARVPREVGSKSVPDPPAPAIVQGSPVSYTTQVVVASTHALSRRRMLAVVVPLKDDGVLSFQTLQIVEVMVLPGRMGGGSN